ncbi:MAG: hypothetical protein Q8R31_05940, partial [Candidatus Omnitrophota bacterium]|nr:hypothetical protein [Candidatus Omnitrophota bacterium]
MYITGLRRGHDIELIVPDTMGDSQMDRVAIVSNATAFNPEYIGSYEKHVWFIHDMANLCKFRLFYPVRKKCKSCPRKDSWIPLMLKAKLIIWLSPLHRQAWLWSAPELANVPYALIPSAINIADFHDLH